MHTHIHAKKNNAYLKTKFFGPGKKEPEFYHYKIFLPSFIKIGQEIFEIIDIHNHTHTDTQTHTQADKINTSPIATFLINLR